MKVCVIGAGPAGLMASLVASQQHQVILIDSQPNVGSKLLLSGNGRCNVTNRREVDDFLKYCSKSSKFMYSALTRFGPHEIIQFFESQGISLHEEDNKRMFPNSNQARDIVFGLVKQNKAEFKLDTYIKEFKIEKKRIISCLTREEEIKADHFILCSGGRSFPSTGSDGSGYVLAKQCGHHRTRLSGVEVGLLTANTQDLMGLSLADRQVQVIVNKKVKFEETGDVLFTHFGLSGPIILKASEFVVEALDQQKPVTLRIKLGEADLSTSTLRKQLGKVAPKRLTDFLLRDNSLADHHLEQIKNSTKDEWLNTLFTLNYKIDGTLPIEKAFVTKGGIKTNEVDPKTMKSKLIENLSFAGEILDIHGMVGGFNITLALSSGYVAGKEI